jgi:hypothetical protein
LRVTVYLTAGPAAGDAGEPVDVPADAVLRPASRVRTPSAVRRISPGAGARECLGARLRRRPSAELFGQSYDDALGTADVAEPIDVLVLRQLADEFGAVRA